MKMAQDTLQHKLVVTVVIISTDIEEDLTSNKKLAQDSLQHQLGMQ
jgi:hypothetical protein